METKVIRAQQRFKDGDMSKKPFAWESPPTDESGVISPGIYEVSCSRTGSEKALIYLPIELPTDDGEVMGMDADRRLHLVRTGLIKEGRDDASQQLRERYETAEQRSKRLAKEEASFKESLAERVMAYSEKHPGEAIPADLMVKWIEEAREG